MTNSKSAQYGDGNYGSSSGVRNGLLYLLVGGGIGATIALLFAPKPGSELRGEISDITKKKYGETLDLASGLKQKTADLYQTAKEKSEHAFDIAAAKLSRTQDNVEDAVETAVERVNGKILDIDSQNSQKHSNAGRKSSSIV